MYYPIFLISPNVLSKHNYAIRIDSNKNGKHIRTQLNSYTTAREDEMKFKSRPHVDRYVLLHGARSPHISINTSCHQFMIYGDKSTPYKSNFACSCRFFNVFPIKVQRQSRRSLSKINFYLTKAITQKL